jgi:hypothetical protein
MIAVVAPAVAQVDPADERDIEFGASRMAQDDELLVVSRCERQISPRTRAPRSAAAQNARETVVPASSRAWSGSPRQSVNSTRSPARTRARQLSNSRKYTDPWISGFTSLPADQGNPSR